MPQLQLPIFPDGTTEINTNLAFERRDGQVTYFYGCLPVFTHCVDDNPTFRMITSQFYLNGSAKQSEICRAFNVKPINVKRAVKLYKEKGPAGFFEKPNRRGAAVLTEAVLEKAQQLLTDGLEITEVARELELKADTLRKAVRAGRLIKSVKKN